jgi:DsbC/DsbD-like thiol-disulfide interchange protein
MSMLAGVMSQNQNKVDLKMIFNKYIIKITALLLIVGSTLYAQSAPPTRAELKLFSNYKNTEQKEFFVAAEFKIADEWYLYYKYPGDAGLPTNIKFEISDNLEAGTMIWPVPEKFISSDQITGYGYKKELTLLLPVKIKDFNKNKFEIKAKATWLACSDRRCQPGSANANTAIDISHYSNQQAELIKNTLSKIPKDLSQVPELGHTGLNIKNILEDGKVSAELILNWTEPTTVTSWVPEPNENLKIKELGITNSGNDTKIDLIINKKDPNLPWPKEISSIIVFSNQAHNTSVKVATDSSNL